MLISFDPEIKWKESYRRNNRSRIQKHILCFPNHTANHHISYGFCGQSIRILANFPFDKAETYMVVGRFSVINGDQSDIVKIGDTLNIADLKYSDTLESPFYPGEIILDNNKNVCYLINPRLTAWRYSITLYYNKNQLISFFVYLFQRDEENPSLYRCIESINSPPFKLCSSRRANHSDIDSPVVKTEINSKKTSCTTNATTSSSNDTYQLFSPIKINTDIYNGSCNCNINSSQPSPTRLNQQQNHNPLPPPPPSLLFPLEYESSSPEENKKTPLEVCTVPLSPQNSRRTSKSPIQPETLSIKADRIIKYKETNNNEEFEICRLLQSQTFNDPYDFREELDSYGNRYVPGTPKGMVQIDSKGNVCTIGETKNLNKNYIIFCEDVVNS